MNKLDEIFTTDVVKYSKRYISYFYKTICFFPDDFTQNIHSLGMNHHLLKPKKTASNILSNLYPLFRLFNSFYTTKDKPVRVLLCHDIPPCDEHHFYLTLKWLQNTWKFITPQEFIQHISGAKPVTQRSLLLTFDDSNLSNLYVAQRVLKPLDIYAIFFVIYDFIKLTEIQEINNFVRDRLFPNRGPFNIPEHFRNMTWDHLEYLQRQGHTIGAHTKSHPRLSTLAESDLRDEIILSADLLEQKLNCEIRHFAYTFGDLQSFNTQALKLASYRFDTIFTGMRGNDYPRDNPYAIRRDSMSPSDSKYLIGSFLECAADLLYSNSLKTYDSWL